MITADEIRIIALSLKVACISLLVTVPLSIFFGWILARRSFFLKQVFEGLLNLPLVLPPVTIGYLLLLVLGVNGYLGQTLNQRFGFRISFTFWAAVLASIVVSFPLVLRSVKTAFQMIDKKYEEASLSLGKSPVYTFLHISMPLALPGIISGSILGFARSLGEFGATITFAGNIGGETRTLPLAIYTSMQIPGNEASSMRLVLFSVVISLIAMIGTGLIKRRN